MKTKAHLLTRRWSVVFSALCSYSISLRYVSVSAPLQWKLPQLLRRRSTVCLSTSVTCNQFVSLSRLPITSQCRSNDQWGWREPLSPPEGVGKELYLDQSRVWGGGVGSASWPRRVKSIDVNEPGWHEKRLSIIWREATCEHLALQHENKMTHWVLNIWAAIWTDRQSLFITLLLC